LLKNFPREWGAAVTRMPRIVGNFAATATATLLGISCLATLSGCVGDGDLTVLGYSTVPPYDPNIRSVHIPVFKNVAFVTDPYRGIEVEATQAIVKELGRRRSPIRVVGDPSRADTELIGTILQIDKGVLNRSQLNFARELELVVTAEVVWRDLRTGAILTNPRRGAVAVVEPFDPSLPPPPQTAEQQVPIPVRITAVGRFIPELGESNASAQKLACDMLAKQIVDMFEAPW